VVKVVIIATKVGNVKVLVVKNVLFLDQSKMTQKHPLWLLKNPLGTTGCKKCIIFGSIKNDSETSSMVTEKPFGYDL
jgi:hypothetical protein